MTRFAAPHESGIGTTRKFAAVQQVDSYPGVLLTRFACTGIQGVGELGVALGRALGSGDVRVDDGLHCRRRLNFEPLCRTKSEPGLVANFEEVSCA